MANSRRAERERASGNHAETHAGVSGSNPESTGNSEQQPDLSAENRNPVVVEPESAKSSPASSSNPARTRSNNRGSRNSNSPASVRRREQRTENSEKSKEGIGVLLAGIHSFGAKLVHECLELDESEAMQMADAIHRVNELYDGGFISPKAAAWGNLAMCFGQVYVPRAMVIMRTTKKKPAAPVAVVPKGVN